MFMKKWGGLSYLNIRGLILEIRPKAYVYDRSGHLTHKVIGKCLIARHPCVVEVARSEF
jgi:hypothetical protein